MAMKISAIDNAIGSIHAEWHFAKPYRTRGRKGAGNWQQWHSIFWGNVSGPVDNLTTLRTTNFQQFPMHMNHIGITCAFMQVVYILRHQQKAIAEQH